MDKKEDKVSRRSPENNEDFSSVTKRRTRDFEQLILLHKRFEADALRYFRRGYVLVSPSRSTSENKPEEQCFARDLSRKMMLDYFPRVSYLNDNDYVQELLGNYGGKLDKNLGFNGERVTLKLPKLESISPANKAIFYTTLPKIPSLPARKEIKKKGIYSFGGNATRHRNSRGKDESFFRTKPATLTRKGDLYEDLNAIKTVRESNCKMGAQIQVVLPRVEATNGRKKDEKRNFANQDCRPNLENDFRIKNTSKNFKCLEEGKGKLLKSDGKNVHFCELLHEVHVYSPSMSSR